MPSLILDLNITADAMLDYYRGRARVVIVTAASGQTVQFPAQALQAHVRKDGVHGRFELVFDDQQRFVGLKPIPSALDVDGTV